MQSVDIKICFVKSPNSFEITNTPADSSCHKIKSYPVESRKSFNIAASMVNHCSPLGKNVKLNTQAAQGMKFILMLVTSSYINGKILRLSKNLGAVMLVPLSRGLM